VTKGPVEKGKKDEVSSPQIVDDSKDKYMDIRSELVSIVANVDSYKVGDTAELTITSPFVPAEGIASVKCNGIIKTIPFSMSTNTTSMSSCYLY
jgi:hypothetical protein